MKSLKTGTRLRTPPRVHFLLFALFFALVGGVLLYKSFALNPNLPGDVNNDNIVNISDLSLLLSHYNQDYPQADFNSDGKVTILDLSVVLSNYNRTYTPAPPPPPPGGGGGSPSVWVAASGNDSTCARGNSAKPCSSFNRAYQIAIPGDIVEIAAGSYPDQTFTRDNSKTSQTLITFRPAPSASVQTGQLIFGVRDGQSSADHLVIDGQNRMTVGEINFFLPDSNNPATDITIQNLKLARDNGVYIRGADKVTLKNVEIGPICCSDDGMQVNYTDAFRSNRDVTNLTLDGVYMHDVVRYCSQDPSPKPGCSDSSDSHTDCIQWWSGVNVTIRNSKFYNCSTSTWLIQDEFGGRFANWKVENNMLGQSIEDAVNVFRVACSGACFSGYLHMTHNTIANDLIIDDGSLTSGTDVQVAGNLINSQGCSQGATYTDNVVTGTACSASERLVGDIKVIKLGAPNTDLHLRSDSPAVDSISCHIGLDLDLQPRPIGVKCDAGADER